jgi:cell division protein FtsA
MVVTLNGPAKAIDDALLEAERMSGYQVDDATININGSHILTSHADGMIAVGGADHEISGEDVDRVKEFATLGKIPANREILDVISHEYKLDGQDNIKDPVGMVGTRLEIKAHVVSALTPHIANLRKAAELANLIPRSIVASGVAAARAVLTEQQIENGVVLLDIGGATTSVVVYEDGDLQYIGVVPFGGVHITNDLAIGLKTDPEIAEKLKLEHASAVIRGDGSGVSVKHNNEVMTFQTEDIDEIVEARLEEIFESVNKELKRAGRAGKLPGGAVLVGGTSEMKGMAEYAKNALGLAARVGVPSGFEGVAEGVESPQFATAIGLLLFDADKNSTNMKLAGTRGSGMMKRFFDRFRA